MWVRLKARLYGISRLTSRIHTIFEHPLDAVDCVRFKRMGQQLEQGQLTVFSDSCTLTVDNERDDSEPSNRPVPCMSSTAIATEVLIP